jgi:uncharacterized protein YneF (UPF0154 family)
MQVIIGLVLGLGLGMWIGIFLAKRTRESNTLSLAPFS